MPHPIFPLRLDPDRRARYEAAAKATGVSVSEWLRDAGDARLALPADDAAASLVPPAPRTLGDPLARRDVTPQFKTERKR